MDLIDPYADSIKVFIYLTLEEAVPLLINNYHRSDPRNHSSPLPPDLLQLIDMFQATMRADKKKVVDFIYHRLHFNCNSAIMNLISNRSLPNTDKMRIAFAIITAYLAYVYGTDQGEELRHLLTPFHGHVAALINYEEGLNYSLFRINQYHLPLINARGRFPPFFSLESFRIANSLLFLSFL